MIPAFVAAALVFTSESFLFASTSTETSELGSDLSWFFPNVKKYLYLIFDWLSGWAFWKINILSARALSFLSGSVAGVILLASLTNKNAKKDCLYLAFICVYFVGNCLMPYSQGLRYVYPILPFLFLFLIYGVQVFFHAVSQEKNMEKLKNLLLLTLAGLIFLLPLQYAAANMKNNKNGSETGAYSISAKDMYRYIIQNTPPDSIISFYEARALYLNTGRLSVPNQLVYPIIDTDYFLESSELAYYLPETMKGYFSLVHENSSFRLWKNTNKPELAGYTEKIYTENHYVQIQHIS